MARPGITFRPITDADSEFLRHVYASTRAEELAAAPWTAEQKESFLRMQFDAQHRHYQSHYPEASFDLILQDDQPIGRLYVSRTSDEMRIIDIALLPEHRRHGIGGALMRQLLAESAAAGRVVSIHVEKFNPAFRLYERLGFRPIEDQGVYLLMRWIPGTAPA